MYLSLLSKEEKNYFADLVLKVVIVDGEMTELEKKLTKRLSNEMGDEVSRHRSNLSLDKLIKYFSAKSKTIRNIIYLNVLSVSLHDDFYSVEEHFLLDKIKEEFQITDKKRAELMKIVYAERDLREKAKRVVTE